MDQGEQEGRHGAFLGTVVVQGRYASLSPNELRARREWRRPDLE